ncbi:MAG: alkaline phosphatase family protein [Thermoplasmata archaeon]|nr:MAG: alkaline phosphatase family protein [Thermoplasmata archaeon]
MGRIEFRKVKGIKSVFGIVIGIVLVLSGIQFWTAGNVEATSPSTFDMYTTEKVHEIGNAPGQRQTTFDIELRNFADEENTVDLSIEWDPSQPPDWSADINPNPVDIPPRVSSTQPGIAFTFLTVTAPNNLPVDNIYEDNPVTINVIGDSQLPEDSYINIISVAVIMNTYDADIFCEEPFKMALPGETVNDVIAEYLITVTNGGRIDDVFDLIPVGDCLDPTGPWDTKFYFYDPNPGNPRVELPKGNGHPNYYDTGTLAPEGSLDIIMEIITTTGSEPKYYKGDITVVADSINDGGDKAKNNDQALTTTLIVGLLSCISDEFPDDPHFYYENDFRGHNVNPASSTSYKIIVFKRQAGTYNVNLNIVSPLPDYWHYSITPSLIHFSAGEPVGAYRNATLIVTAPANAILGNYVETVVSSEDSVDLDSVKVKTKVTSDRKVYILNLDAVGPRYLDLARDGTDWTSGDERLMPNIWQLIQTGSRYTGTTDCLPAVTDCNHVSIITSTPTGVHGIPGVGAYYTGMDPTDNYPKIAGPSPQLIVDQGIETIYDTLYDSKPELRTGVIVGKNWVAELFNGDDCDIMAHGQTHPFYMREPGWAKFGDYAPGSDTDIPPGDTGFSDYHLITDQIDQQTDSIFTVPGEIARHFPTDKWVVDSTIEMIENEDPDFIYVLLANGDDSGHAYGHAWDPNVDPRTINIHANPEDMLDTMAEVDRQVGKFLAYLDQTNRYEDSIVVVTADHAMTTHAQYNEIDIKEYLLHKDIIMGRDYDFIFSEGSFIWIFGIENDPPGPGVEHVEEILEIDFNNDFPGRLWEVLSVTDTKNEQKDNMNTYDGKDFALFNQIYYDHNDLDITTIKQPDIIIYTDTVTGTDTTSGLFENVGYVDAIIGGANALNIDIDLLYIPREGRVPYLIGNHATWSEQHVPLIFHGLGIQQGYENTDDIFGGTTTMDIMPTICEINNWPQPNDGNPDMAGKVLNDCFSDTNKITVSPDGIGDYSTIQTAISAANPGDVVFVTSNSIGGNQETTTYKESITIDKSISLIADRVLPPMILGDRWDEPPTNYDIITITSNANHVKVKGFEISSSGGYGVLIDSGCDNNLIYGNSFTLNGHNALDLGSDNRWYNGYYRGDMELNFEGDGEKYEYFGGGNLWFGPNWGPEWPVWSVADLINNNKYSLDEFSGEKSSADEDQTEPYGDYISDISYIDQLGNVEDWYPIAYELIWYEEKSNWIVSGFDVRNSAKIILSGDLIITSGATLMLINSDLVMNSLYDGEYNIIIEEGGKLLLSTSEVYANNPLNRYGIYGDGEITQEFSNIRDVHPYSTFGRCEDRIYYGDPLDEYTTLDIQFPVGGGEEIAYLMLPRTADVFYASFDLTGEPIDSNFPTDPAVDVGNDQIVEWSYMGPLTTTIQVSDLNTIPIFEISVQEYLDEYQPDENGFISIPMLFSSVSEGELIISNLEIGYTTRWTWAEFSQSHSGLDCYYNKYAVDIYYTGDGEIRIDDSLCPSIDYSITIPEQNWVKPATVKHCYYDENDDGIVDGTSIPESTLVMYWWDENTHDWVPTTDIFGEENTGVKAVDNFVWTNVDHFSSFTTKGSYVPRAETDELINTIIYMDIPHGIKTSLLAKLEVTLTYLNAAQDHFINGDLDLGNEDLISANNKLNDFINEVEAQRGKTISEEDAEILINDAQEIVDLIDEAFV